MLKVVEGEILDIEDIYCIVKKLFILVLVVMLVVCDGVC